MPLPTTKRFRDLLESQLNRQVTMHPADALAAAGPHLCVAVYVDHRLATQAVAVLDLAAAAYIGAAQALLPVGVATSAVRAGTLPAMVEERLRGVLQGWAPLFPGDDVRLYDVTLPGERPPNDVVALTAAPGRRLDLALTVRAYGEGRLSLVQGR